MPLVDATLASGNATVCWLFFADFADLPIRGALFAPCPVHVPTGLPDSDVDCAGFTFPVADSRVLDISPVSHEEGGSDTVQFTLFADPGTPDLLSAIENPALYVGRKVRVWLAIIDMSVTTSGGANVIQLRPLYRGYMTQPAQQADADVYTISMQAENYLALLAGPQGRSDIQATLYDPTDNAGRAQKARANQAIPGMPGGGYFGPVNGDYFPRYEP